MGDALYTMPAETLMLPEPVSYYECHAPLPFNYSNDDFDDDIDDDIDDDGDDDYDDDDGSNGNPSDFLHQMSYFMLRCSENTPPPVGKASVVSRYVCIWCTPMKPNVSFILIA